MKNNIKYPEKMYCKLISKAMEYLYGACSNMAYQDGDCMEYVRADIYERERKLAEAHEHNNAKGYPVSVFLHNIKCNGELDIDKKWYDYQPNERDQKYVRADLVPQWHDASKELPNEETYVLCACGTKGNSFHIMQRERYESKDYWYTMDNISYSPVIAWMEIPQCNVEL